ncbi:MAG: MBL fold metallo-hydrolase [Bacteroidetes bacterium]|nr:MAG: MBL fold metallo-hydrolase [Bacteroidota bacterium]
MALSIASLNSGSNGNCYYIGNENEAVLIDGGISCRETEKRMKRLGLSMAKVKALFVTHEHSDHISGVPGLAKKYQFPIYITEKTRKSCGFILYDGRGVHFEDGQNITVGNLTVYPFRKFHDAIDPFSFVVSDSSVKVGVFTDIGIACDRIKQQFAHCHAVFLESNYDSDMLEKGSYPKVLKKRISGGEGHLSNTLALELFNTYRSRYLSHLILSHLSQNNNRTKIVEDLFAPYAGSTEIIVASRHHETKLILVDGKFLETETIQLPKLTSKPFQLSIF